MNDDKKSKTNSAPRVLEDLENIAEGMFRFGGYDDDDVKTSIFFGDEGEGMGEEIPHKQTFEKHGRNDQHDFRGPVEKKRIFGKDVNPDELSMGLKIEMKHIKDPEIALHVAMDHLAEINDYYTRLKKMKSNAK